MTSGLNKNLIIEISKSKNEPQWMTDFRLSSYEIFLEKCAPCFGPDLSGLDLDKICYYKRPSEKINAVSWDDVPPEIKKTFQKLGIPEAEQKVLAGAGAQYESEVVYHNLKEYWKNLGVIYEDLSSALLTNEDLVKKYFGKLLTPGLHKYMALHYAVWSGGTFLYIPKNTRLEMPVQSYFRINTPGMGQFEHTLIVAEESSFAHYIEGCSAPRYDVAALHAGGVEIYVGKNAHFRYSSVENWSRDVYNLNTKRALVEENGIISWVTGNMGSKVSMIYPCTILKGDNSRAENLSIAMAGDGQTQDIGAKTFHIGKNTKSNTISKSFARKGGKTIFRAITSIGEKADNARAHIKCDGLILDSKSASETYPTNIIKNSSGEIIHEATIGSLDTEKLFYLNSRGLNAKEATTLVINGFIEPIMKEIPLEYAVEMNRLIEEEIYE